MPRGRRSMKVPKNIAKQVIGWYSKHRRPLPWRRTRDPYAIWISEVMLQQTQVQTTIPYYRRFLSRFPNVETLAKADLQDVLKTWENMGYYSRARHAHEAAKRIVDQHGGKIPATMDALCSLPGIGPYIASAILCFAFGRRIATVEANVSRVLCRLNGIQTPMERASTRKRLFEMATAMVPASNPDLFNQGLMDLGATVCTPRGPACGRCPVAGHCQALKSRIQEMLPMKKKRAPLPHRRMTAAIIRDRKRRVLIVQRPPEGLLGGLWKFPGGECGAGESLDGALKRIVGEELGIRIRIQQPLPSVEHTYTHFRTTLYGFRCSRVGEPGASGCYRWTWAEESMLEDFPFSRVDRKLMDAIPPGIFN